MSVEQAIKDLEKNCTDYSIHNRDFHRSTSYGLNVDIRYEVHAIHFFARGMGLGRTLEEAVTRALKNLEQKEKLFPRASLEDLLNI